MSKEIVPKTCASCGFESTSEKRRCPQCNRALQTSKEIRVRGTLLIVIGAGLSLGMTYLIWIITNIMRHGSPGSTSSFSGTPRDAAFIFGILGMVLVFGIMSLCTGLWQVAYGKPNRVLSGIVLGLGLLMVVLVVLFQLKGQS